MITQLGKFLRKIRIDNDMIIKDMADDLCISVSQLSAIELGKRTINEELRQNIIDKYEKYGSSREEIERLILLSQSHHKEDMDTSTDLQREAFVSFAMSYKALPDDSVAELIEKINELISRT